MWCPISVRIFIITIILSTVLVNLSLAFFFLLSVCAGGGRGFFALKATSRVPVQSDCAGAPPNQNLQISKSEIDTEQPRPLPAPVATSAADRAASTSTAGYPPPS